jgi:hypothetical protein
MNGRDRGPILTILSILFYIFGVVEIVAGLSLLSLGHIASSIFFYTGVLAWVTIALGIVVVIIGVADFLAGRWLWRAKRKGGILGFITAIIALIVNAIFLSTEPVSSIFGIILSIVVIALIAIAWKRLQ